ncbi:facilitated trehalose transporter Tret1 isoform X2 [Cephus cinctus]|nr:facilitated trehalose transporter Tret1 isoform X2 [Cephus cinctus]
MGVVSFHFAIGLSMAYSAILTPSLEAADSELVVSKTETSWIASIVVLSTPIGALIASMIMEPVGRLKVLQIGAIPCILGWILIAAATNVPMILVGRFLSGLATAMNTSPAIVYITEVAKPDLRGSLISIGPALASLGMVVVYVKGAFLTWRLTAWLNIIYVVVPVIFVQFLPESPTWLVSKGRTEEAKASVEWFYRLDTKSGKASAADAHFNSLMKENEIKRSEQRRSNRGNFSQKLRAFAKPTGWKPIFILFLFFFFQQFSGIYITLFYAVTWFQEVGAKFDEYLASILVGVTRFLCSMVNTWLLRRYKRRPLCIISALGMCICMSVSGYFTLQNKNGDTSGHLVPVVCLILYVCTSMIGMLTIPWTMTAELFPTEIRGIAHAISYSIANLLMFAAIQSYRSLKDFLGGSYQIQWFFAGISLAAVVFIWLLLPETHGKTLLQIEEYFQTNFLAVGAESKAKKRRAKRRAQQKTKTAVMEPLNPKNVQTA